jgi:hypothetical protein
MWRRLSRTALSWLLLAPVLSASLSADEPYGRHQFTADVRDHWSFQSVERPEVPAVSEGAWIRNPIDAFILAGLEQAGLKPAPKADRSKLLRRVYLDLIGLPPTPSELDAFLANDGPRAFEQVVDDLLSRPQYGERWARHWLDVVRYAETNGYERDGMKPQAWRFRDWVIDALNADKPYDQFLTEQLAGDEVPGSNAETQIGTTMLRLGPWDDEPADLLSDRYDQLDDIVATTSATFIGLTLRCARCHNHKFEPFSQQDYTRWQAIFAPLNRPQKDKVEFDREVGPPDQVAAHLALVKQLDAQTADIETQVRTLGWQVCQEAVAAGRLKTEKTADAGTAGSDVLPSAKELPPEALAAIAIEPDKRNDAQKKLVRTHAAKLATMVRELASVDRGAQLDECERQLTAVKAKYPPPLQRGYIWYEDGPSFDASHVFRRGDPRNPGEEVGPGFPAILIDHPPAPPAPTAYSTGRRLQLARWLTQPDHPLTARVMVNRLWQHHFGDGIVATENDFGVMGSAPSNQPLLDWLASEFVAGGWQIKRMHRMMVLSQTYQMASTANPAAEKIDPEDALLWRFRPRRMEAEALRDTILAVSGQLNPSPRGPGIYPKISQAVLETQSRPGDGWKTSDPAAAARRSVYIFVKRTLLLPEMEVLDFPSTEETCEQRVVSTVAPQALTLLNGEFINEQAQAFAQRIAREAGDDNAARVERAYRLAFSRPPSEKERATVLDFLVRQQQLIEADAKGEASDAKNAGSTKLKALAALCLVLFNTNEFAYLQ